MASCPVLIFWSGIYLVLWRTPAADPAATENLHQPATIKNLISWQHKHSVSTSVKAINTLVTNVLPQLQFDIKHVCSLNTLHELKNLDKYGKLFLLFFANNG